MWEGAVVVRATIALFFDPPYQLSVKHDLGANSFESRHCVVKGGLIRTRSVHALDTDVLLKRSIICADDGLA